VPRIVRGPGDDAAVVRARAFAVTSVDTMVDGVHFRLEQVSAADAGHRALAGALSDLAAMGADAGEAYVALGLPPGFGDERALEVVGAMAELARASGSVVRGGDVTPRARPDIAVHRRRLGRHRGGAGRPRRRLAGRRGRGHAGPWAALPRAWRSSTGAPTAAPTAMRCWAPTAARSRARRRVGGWPPAGATAMIVLSDGLAGRRRPPGPAQRRRVEIALGRCRSRPASPRSPSSSACPRGQLGRRRRRRLRAVRLRRDGLPFTAVGAWGRAGGGSS
jgi:thiamine-monophosphate kinase